MMKVCRNWIVVLLCATVLASNALAANEVPAARPVTDGKTKAEVVKLVRQMQVLFHEAEARTDSVLAQLALLTQAHNDALIEAQAMQLVVDTRTAERDGARLEAAREAKAKWMWFALFLVSAFSFAAFAYFKR